MGSMLRLAIAEGDIKQTGSSIVGLCHYLVLFAWFFLVFHSFCRLMDVSMDHLGFVPNTGICYQSPLHPTYHQFSFKDFFFNLR